MKIGASDADAFVRRPNPECAAILVYGPDAGLVGERIAALLASEAPVDDPFGGPVELTAAAVRSDPALLADEAAALSFGGNRRIVRLRDATDAVADVVAEFLEDAPTGGLVVAEAGDLGPRSSLRKAFESARNAAAVPCYADSEADVKRVIADTLATHGIGIDTDAVDYLAQNLGSDRAVTRGEIEKLALYVGDSGRVTVDDAAACIGDSAATSMDAVAAAAAGGDVDALDRSLSRAFSEGVAAVTVLRAVARHFMRLHQARGFVAAGRTADQAMGLLKPKVFFKQQGAFRKQIGLWSETRIAGALDILVDAEMDCKSTGMPEDVICARALMRLAQAAARSAGPR